MSESQLSEHYVQRHKDGGGGGGPEDCALPQRQVAFSGHLGEAVDEPLELRVRLGPGEPSALTKNDPFVLG